MTDKRLYTILDLSDPALGRFLNPDPEVQLPDNTQSYNRYTYCLNNPLRYADPTGKYAMGNNRFKLAHYQELLQKEYDELNVYWGTTNDALEQDYIKLRLNQLEESIEDINDIIKDPFYEYTFKNGSNPMTVLSENDPYQVDIITDNSMGSIIHEIRHAGQFARRDFSFASYDTPDEHYGVSFEISAYQAQIAYCGYLQYLPYYDFDNDLKATVQLGLGGLNSLTEIITNIQLVNPTFIRNMCEGNDITDYHRIYDYGEEWFKK